MPGPLQGFRIVDITTVGMGPYCAQTLGDLGADVIKLESPEGDMMRNNAPGRNPGMASLFLQLNRSKRSLVLDLKRPAGRDALLRLARGADALLCNVRPKAMARLGLGYAAVAAENPRIVYCSLVGFGQEGPYAARAALDDLIQGGVGIPALAARAGGEPRYAPGWFVDQTVGLVAAYTVLAALLHRERSGEGQYVEVPMFESMAQYMMTPHLYGETFRPAIGGAGYVRVLERRPFKTKDGHLCAIAYTPPHWRRFFDVIGRPELKDDPRFKDGLGVARHVRELYDLFAEEALKRTTADWLGLLEKADIPAMPMHTPETLLEDPHLKAVGFFQEVEHPSEGAIRTMAVPTRWSRSKPSPSRHAPRLGEHSVEVLREAGLSAEEVNEMLRQGVTIDPSVRSAA